MSPASYRAAPPRVDFITLAHTCPALQNASPLSAGQGVGNVVGHVAYPWPGHKHYPPVAVAVGVGVGVGLALAGAAAFACAASNSFTAASSSARAAP
jgi:hypothetical protein